MKVAHNGCFWMQTPYVHNLTGCDLPPSIGTCACRPLHCKGLISRSSLSSDAQISVAFLRYVLVVWSFKPAAQM
eukprot:12926682-Prorocentrum_lima.AAC.1